MPASAQSTQGSIIGTVTDGKGGVVPGATVTLTNTDENTVRTTTTNASGDYSFLDSKAGNYRLEVTAPNFQKSVTNSLVLSAQQVLRVNAPLKVGDVSQTVEVSGSDTAVVNLDTPEINTSFKPEDIVNLPTNSRTGGFSTGLMALGIAAQLPNVDFKPTQSVFHSFSVNGAMTAQTQFDADGVTIAAISGNHPDGVLLPVADAIAEIRSSAALGDSEHGSPAEIIVTTKSGTNTLHGGAWWYNNNTNLNARAYGAASRPHVVQNVYGAMLSGPVYIPKVYNGKNRSFFWFDWESMRSPSQSAKQYSVPTADILKGDFTNFIIPDGNGGNQFQGLFNPATGTYCGLTFAQCGFSINPVAEKYLQFWPAPNHTGTITLNGGGTQTIDTNHYAVGQTANYWANYDNTSKSDQFDVRGDQYFGSNQKLLVWGRMVYANQPFVSIVGINFPTTHLVDADRNVILSANWTIAPTLINEFRAGYARFAYAAPQSVFDGKSFTDSLGLQGLASDLWQTAIPYMSVPYFSGTPGRLVKPYDNKSWVYTDNLNWVKGNHTMRFGANFSAYKAITPTNPISADQFGNFYFGNNGTWQATGNGWADFLLGLPYQTRYDDVPADNNYIAHNIFFYAQDQWKVNSRLTLTGGLRYEYNGGFYDKNGLMGNFDVNTTGTGRLIYPDGGEKYLNTDLLASINACDYGGTTLNGVGCLPVVSASTAGVDKSLHHNTKTNFQPRVGFAYRLTGDDKWVIRGGFGIYGNWMSADQADDGAGGLIQIPQQTYYNSYVGGGTFGTPAYQLPEIYAGTSTAGKTSSVGHFNLNTVPGTDWHDPYTEQWTLTLEHNLGNGYGVRASYIGNVSRHLFVEDDRNYFPYSTTTEAYDQPFSARPFPNMGIVKLMSTRGSTNYHALELDVTHRYQNGWSFESTLNYGKELGNVMGSGSNLPEEDGESSIYAPNLDLDYGTMEAPRKLAWKSNATWAIPVGRGLKYGSHMNRIADIFIGGWVLSNIFEWDSGDYLSITMGGSNDPSGTGSGTNTYAAGYNSNNHNQYADRVAGQSLYAKHKNATQWLNPDAVTCPGDPNWKPGFGCYTGNGHAINTQYNGQTYNNQELIDGVLYTIPGPIGRFGKLRPGSIVGPGFIQLNSGLSKTFSLSERFKFRIEGTFTNVLNHTNLDGSSMTLNPTSTSYGYISSAIAARNGQVSARLTF